MHAQLRLAAIVVALFSSCRFVGPPVPQVTPARPSLLSSTTDAADPTRQTTPPARRCVVECGPGYVCNEQRAECEPDARQLSRDAGVTWMP